MRTRDMVSSMKMAFFKTLIGLWTLMTLTSREKWRMMLLILRVLNKMRQDQVRVHTHWKCSRQTPLILELRRSSTTKWTNQPWETLIQTLKLANHSNRLSKLETSNRTIQILNLQELWMTFPRHLTSELSSLVLSIDVGSTCMSWPPQKNRW